MGGQGLDYSDLGWGRVNASNENCKELSCSVKGGYFID